MFILLNTKLNHKHFQKKSMYSMVNNNTLKGLESMKKHKGLDSMKYHKGLL